MNKVVSKENNLKPFLFVAGNFSFDGRIVNIAQYDIQKEM
jgi:hypothetical protein